MGTVKVTLTCSVCHCSSRFTCRVSKVKKFTAVVCPKCKTTDLPAAPTGKIYAIYLGALSGWTGVIVQDLTPANVTALNKADYLKSAAQEQLRVNQAPHN
jgi:hypothetical protein